MGYVFFLKGLEMLKRIGLVLVIVLVSWGYQAIHPPPPKICGSPGGPPITAPRIKLRDGRHLAYKEYGVPLGVAKYKIIFVHAFGSCRHHTVVATTLSQEAIEELGVYIVGFDRPGYGESDPNPNRTVKSMASDIEELADHLKLGSKFYVVGFSLGGQVIWSVLKYIPHRVAGAALIAPVFNHWWTGFPANLSKEVFDQQTPCSDRWALRVAHYIPWLTYWWNTQNWFPYMSAVAHSPDILSSQDREIVMLPLRQARKTYMAQVRQQGEFESIHRDIIVTFGKWEFSPLELKNPFPNNEGSVHLWHGDEDKIVPISPQRYIAQQLPWIHFHELTGAGHLFPEAEGMCDKIIKELLVRKK